MLASNVNPGLWASWDLRVADKQFDTRMQLLLSQLSQFAVQTQQALSQLSSIANSSLQYISFNPGAVSTNQSLECVGAEGIVATLQIATAVNLTLTLNHVAPGVLVVVRFVNGAGTTQTFKLAYTTPSGAAGAPYAFNGGTAFNLTSTGSNLSTTQQRLLVGSADETGLYLTEA